VPRPSGKCRLAARAWRTGGRSGRDELRGLLKAAFSDWVDFGLFLSPARFALAADHDEWTRIFAARKSYLGKAAARLAECGVEVISPSTGWRGGRRSNPGCGWGIEGGAWKVGPMARRRCRVRGYAPGGRRQALAQRTSAILVRQAPIRLQARTW